MNDSRPSSRWLPVHTLAIFFSLGHVILDWYAQLFGLPAATMTGTQVLVLILGAGLYALWASALALAIQGSQRAMLATIGLSAVASLNGFSIVACLPPCAFPVGDISHIGSLIFCLWAIFESWRALKRISSTHARQAGQTGAA